MPDDEQFSCADVQSWIDIKLQWQLSVASDQMEALEQAQSKYCLADGKPNCVFSRDSLCRL